LAFDKEGEDESGFVYSLSIKLQGDGKGGADTQIKALKSPVEY
jgi:hypothetical protein